MKSALRWLGLIILAGLVGYGTYYAFDVYGLAGFGTGLPIFIIVFRRLLRPAGTYVIEARETGMVNLFYFPDEILERYAIEGDMKFAYHTRKGKPVLIADHIDFDNRLIQLAWSHHLSHFEFMRDMSVFVWCRDALYEQTRKNALLEGALADLVALGVEEQVDWAVRPVLRRLGIEEEEVEKAIRILRLAQEVELYAERAPGGGTASQA
ncbi:MAG: hypothetical protein DRJ43_05360 [Thermoprotei archaeon]|nr:MAG: hypothetical protein DRJ43_05360 [Thermoprotei archaeon]